MDKRVVHLGVDLEYLDDSDVRKIVIKGKYPDERYNVWEHTHKE